MTNKSKKYGILLGSFTDDERNNIYTRWARACKRSPYALESVRKVCTATEWAEFNEVYESI